MRWEPKERLRKFKKFSGRGRNLSRFLDDCEHCIRGSILCCSIDPYRALLLSADGKFLILFEIFYFN